jgi:hypothetical protein
MRTRTTLAAALLAAGALLGWLASSGQPTTALAQEKQPAQKSPGGFPAPDEVQRLYDEADLNRAIQAYRFFYPNVSIAGLFAGFEAVGAVDNKSFLVLEGKPNGVLFTPNSDTPYAAVPLDLKAGPVTVELPAGPLLGVANDLNFRWVIDMGLPGPGSQRRASSSISTTRPITDRDVTVAALCTYLGRHAGRRQWRAAIRGDGHGPPAPCLRRAGGRDPWPSRGAARLTFLARQEVLLIPATWYNG